MKRFALASVVVILSLLVTPTAFLQDSGDALSEPREEFSTAEVIGILQEDTNDDFGMSQTTQHIRLQILNGPEEGKEIDAENGIVNNREDMRLSVGDTVVLDKTTTADGSELYLIKESYRLPSLIWLTIFFIAITILLGRWTGVTSIIGLAVSVLILTLYVLPRVVAGDNPLITCLIGAAAIACTSLYFAHGFNKRTSVAFLSTMVTLVIATVTSIIYVSTSKLFGMGSDEAVILQTGMLAHVDLRGLLLGGIIIGCLGVLDDITTAQCAAVDEISKANPSLTSHELRKAGFSVGREHIASLINTLALAYAGASLPLLLLFKTQSTYPLWVILNGEFLAEEIIRTLVGSMTLVIAVPVATYFASVMLRAKPGSRPQRASEMSHHH